MFYLNNDYSTSLRYDMAKFLEYNEDNYDIITSYFIKRLKDIPYSGVRVISSEAGKPDLLSYMIYGHTQYWWILLLYNDIMTINKLEVGMQVIFPSIDGLEALYFQLAAIRSANE